MVTGLFLRRSRDVKGGENEIKTGSDYSENCMAAGRKSLRTHQEGVLYTEGKMSILCFFRIFFKVRNKTKNKVYNKIIERKQGRKKKRRGKVSKKKGRHLKK